MNTTNRFVEILHSIVAFASTCRVVCLQTTESVAGFAEVFRKGMPDPFDMLMTQEQAALQIMTRRVAVHRRPQGMFGSCRIFFRPAINTGPTSLMATLAIMFASILFVHSSNAQAQEPTTLTLETCVELALEKNFIVRKSQLEQDKQSEAIRDARGQFDPQLNLGYTATREELLGLPDAEVYETDRYNNGAVSLTGQTVLGTRYKLGVDASETRVRADGSVYQEHAPSASIQVIQPLLKGGWRNSDRTSLELSHKNLEIENWRFQSVVIETVQLVVNAYADLYFATKQLEVATNNRDLAAQLLKDNQKRVSLGYQAESDIILAESRSAQRQEAVFQAELQLHYQQNLLKQLVSDEMIALLDQDFSITDLPEFGEQKPTVAADLERALQENPLFRTAQIGISMRELMLLQRQFDLLPTLDLTLRYDTYGLGSDSSEGWDSLGSRDGEGWYGGLQLQVPIPNRSNRAQHAISRIEMRQQQLELDRIQQAVLLQLDNAAFRLRKAWDRMLSSQHNLELAEGSLKAEEKKLKAGRSTSFFVLDQQQRLAEAQLREISSRVDYFKSLTAYHKERGTLLDVYDVSIPQIEK